MGNTSTIRASATTALRAAAGSPEGSTRNRGEATWGLNSSCEQLGGRSRRDQVAGLGKICVNPPEVHVAYFPTPTSVGQHGTSRGAPHRKRVPANAEVVSRHDTTTSASPQRPAGTRTKSGHGESWWAPAVVNDRLGNKAQTVRNARIRVLSSPQRRSLLLEIRAVAGRLHRFGDNACHEIGEPHKPSTEGPHCSQRNSRKPSRRSARNAARPGPRLHRVPGQPRPS